MSASMYGASELVQGPIALSDATILPKNIRAVNIGVAGLLNLDFYHPSGDGSFVNVAGYPVTAGENHIAPARIRMGSTATNIWLMF